MYRWEALPKGSQNYPKKVWVIFPLSGVIGQTLVLACGPWAPQNSPRGQPRLEYLHGFGEFGGQIFSKQLIIVPTTHLYLSCARERFISTIHLEFTVLSALFRPFYTENT
jgi:hypothetical protein